MHSYEPISPSWRRRLLPLLLGVGFLSACASEPLVTVKLVSNPFPHLTEPQALALFSCAVDQPVLDEWIVRFDKAEAAATN